MSTASQALTAALCEVASEYAPARTDAPWIRKLRERALAHFAERGLPDKKLEAWRHTSLAALERITWSAPSHTALLEAARPLGALGLEDSNCAIYIDGHLDASRSTLPTRGVRVMPIAAARTGGEGEGLLREVIGRLSDTKTDAFTALNTAFLDDGALVEITRNDAQIEPLHIVLATAAAGRLCCPRLAVVARPGSRATLILEHLTIGDGPRLTNLVGEILVEENAQLDIVVVQHESDESFLISDLHSRLARNAKLVVHTLSLGGRLVRNSLGSLLNDTGAEVDMRGLFVGSHRGHIDNHTVADHAMPQCTSRELYKGVLGGASRGVFCGRVIVRPDAQKTDSNQSNPNLLLTRRAEIDTQPQLEIYADDVKCSHGSTIGRLDEDALFYLQSRGIGMEDARVLLTRGFANEIVIALPRAEIRERVGLLVDAALEAAISDASGERT